MIYPSQDFIDRTPMIYPSDVVRLNVRCCCQPVKILGTLEVPAYKAKYPGKIVIGAESDCVASRNALRTTEPVPKPQIIEAELRRFIGYTNGQSIVELAVYSDDRPIEFWKRIPTFVPAYPA
jgi:hypothetical protein